MTAWCESSRALRRRVGTLASAMAWLRISCQDGLPYTSAGLSLLITEQCDELTQQSNVQSTVSFHDDTVTHQHSCRRQASVSALLNLNGSAHVLPILLFASQPQCPCTHAICAYAPACAPAYIPSHPHAHSHPMPPLCCHPPFPPSPKAFHKFLIAMLETC